MPDAAPQADMAAELRWLRRESEILRQGRDTGHRFFVREGRRPELHWPRATGRRMRLRLADRVKKNFPVPGLCKIFGVSHTGYLARRDRPTSRRQRDDMVMLAHVPSAYVPSNGLPHDIC